MLCFAKRIPPIASDLRVSSRSHMYAALFAWPSSFFGSRNYLLHILFALLLLLLALACFAVSGDYLPSIQMICDAIPYTLVRNYGITADAYRAAQKSCRSIGGPAYPRRTQQETAVERLEAAPVLLAVAAQRHFVSGGKGGQLDLYRVAKLILRDFTTGRLLRCHIPGGGVFGADAEAFEAAKFLSVVRRPIEARLEEAEPTSMSAGPPASFRGTRSTIGTHSLRQMNPMAVLQDLEEDSDLLEVIENGEVSKVSRSRGTG